MGPLIAAALVRAGHSLVGITAPSQSDTDRVEAILPGVVYADPLEIIERSELHQPLQFHLLFLSNRLYL